MVRPRRLVERISRDLEARAALGRLVEIGDFRRFASVYESMSFLGLVPSEHSVV